jgi:hypothetical protein
VLHETIEYIKFLHAQVGVSAIDLGLAACLLAASPYCPLCMALIIINMHVYLDIFFDLATSACILLAHS